MRRSLAGIVPDELLNRKRKAFVVRGPVSVLSSLQAGRMGASDAMVLNSMKIVELLELSNALDAVRNGQEISTIPILRALSIESWLRNLTAWNVTNDHGSQLRRDGKLHSYRNPFLVSVERKPTEERR